MGFGAGIIAQVEADRERQARRDQWICSEGIHNVTITSWRYEKARVSRDVVFEVQDDAGRKQIVRFNLAVRSLRDGELLRFVVAAMNWRMVEHQGQTFSIAKRDRYRKLIGRRIAVQVLRVRKHFHEVVDWNPVSNEPDSC